MRVDEVGIGDYVLAGGEAAVLVMVEAVGRLLPGVLGNADSVVGRLVRAGRHGGLLEGPVYTKPPVWRGREVPEILLSGHHGSDRPVAAGRGAAPYRREPARAWRADGTRTSRRPRHDADRQAGCDDGGCRFAPRGAGVFRRFRCGEDMAD